MCLRVCVRICECPCNWEGGAGLTHPFTHTPTCSCDLIFIYSNYKHECQKQDLTMMIALMVVMVTETTTGESFVLLCFCGLADLLPGGTSSNSEQSMLKLSRGGGVNLTVQMLIE